MRIMYIMFSFTVGGTERLVADICNEMSKREHDVYLYIINDYYSEYLLSTIDEKVHIELQNRTIGGKGKFKLVKRITEFIRDNKINVVHSNSFDCPELFVLKKLFFNKTKIFHTVHDVGQYKNLSKLRIWLRNKICDKIIAISNIVHNDVVKFGADQNKVITVYNAINFKKFYEVNYKRLDKSEKIEIGNVARLIPPKKGQDVLIGAIAKVKKIYPQIYCKFAGTYDGYDFSKQLKQLADELNVTDNVAFLGNVDNVPKFLSEINIFVLPSKYEGFGISLIEAMSLGIPCIASNLDGPKELVEKVKCGLLFESGDEGDLADKILFTIENYKVLKEQSIENINTVKELFDIKVMCNKLETLYLN